jgi:hypothetical protein
LVQKPKHVAMYFKQNLFTGDVVLIELQEDYWIQIKNILSSIVLYSPAKEDAICWSDNTHMTQIILQILK